MNKSGKGLSTITLLLSLSLLLVMPFNGWAGNPPSPPPGTKEVGPGVAGTITFVDCGASGTLNTYFSGKCRGESVTFSTSVQGYLDGVTEATLEGASTGGLIDNIPLKCLPDTKKGTVIDLIIDNVKKIDQLAPSVVAVDVNLLFIVVPPTK
jgi:hypothetical protein